MSEVKWIAHNIEIIKKDIRSARELRESQKFYMCMDLEQDLMDAYDLTLLLRQCFGPSFDPSIIFFKFNVKTQTIYILRENEEYFNTYNKELEKYNNHLSADLDFESYGDEKEFIMFMKKNIDKNHLFTAVIKFGDFLQSRLITKEPTDDQLLLAKNAITKLIEYEENIGFIGQ